RARASRSRHRDRERHRRRDRGRGDRARRRRPAWRSARPAPRAPHRRDDPAEPVLGVLLQRRAHPGRGRRALSVHGLAAVAGARRRRDGGLIRDRRVELAAPAYRIPRQVTSPRLLVLLAFLGAACGASGPDLSSASRFPATATPASSPAASAAGSPATTPDAGAVKLVEFPVGPGQGPHDVAPAPDGGVRAIVRIDPVSKEVKVFGLPGPNANLNTAAFDRDGILWFTGQSGYFGHLDPKTGALKVMPSPRGAGPYGITATPDGRIFYASLAGSYIAWIDLKEDIASPIDPPTPGQGARRIWSDSKSQIWVSEWNAGQLGFFSAHVNVWKEWKIPGANPMPYAVYVDDQDIVWLTDFGANAIVRFDPVTEK